MRNTVSLNKTAAEKKMLKPAAAKKSALKKNAGNKISVQPEATESVAGQVTTADVLIIGAGFAVGSQHVGREDLRQAKRGAGG